MPLFKKGTPRGAVSRKKGSRTGGLLTKYENSTPLLVGNKTVPYEKKGTKVAPVGAPNYGHQNSNPRHPFFLSVKPVCLEAV